MEKQSVVNVKRDTILCRCSPCNHKAADPEGLRGNGSVPYCFQCEFAGCTAMVSLCNPMTMDLSMDTLPDAKAIREIREMWKLHSNLPAGDNDTISKNIYNFMVRYNLTYDDWYRWSRKAQEGYTSPVVESLLDQFDRTWENSPDQIQARMRSLYQRAKGRQWTKIEADRYYKLEDALDEYSKKTSLDSYLPIPK